MIWGFRWPWKNACIRKILSMLRKGWMSRGENMMFRRIDQVSFCYGKISPQNKDQSFPLLWKPCDHCIGKGFPPFILVRPGLVCPHGESGIQQQYTLVGPFVRFPCLGAGIPRSVSISLNMLTNEGGGLIPSGTEKQRPWAWPDPW